MSDCVQRKATSMPGMGEKRPSEDLDVSSVHSSNSLEGVNLGDDDDNDNDDDRKKKFLRLMGAGTGTGKKVHHGRFVISESHEKHPGAMNSQHVSEAIEQQARKKVVQGHHHHVVGIRLGFHELKPDEQSSTSSEAAEVRPPSKLKEGDDLNLAEISSTNSWETANLGDDERKKKFLKLMGAGKKSHQGRFVIGNAQTKHVNAQDSQKVSDAIQKQFTETLSHKHSVGFKGRHCGIGFVDPEQKLLPDSSEISKLTADDSKPHSAMKGENTKSGADPDDINDEHLERSRSYFNQRVDRNSANVQQQVTTHNSNAPRRCNHTTFQDPQCSRDIQSEEYCHYHSSLHERPYDYDGGRRSDHNPKGNQMAPNQSSDLFSLQSPKNIDD